MGTSAPAIVFSNSFDALHRVVEGSLGADLLGSLRTSGIDFGKPLLPAYPRDTWIAFIQVASRARYPKQDEATALESIGRLLITGYMQTNVGKATIAMAQVLGPRRTLERMTKNLRTSDNFTETTATERGPCDVELWISDGLALPTFYQGFVAGMVERSGAKGVAASVASHQIPELRLRLTWEA